MPRLGVDAAGLDRRFVRPCGHQRASRDSSDVVRMTGLYGANGPKRFQMIRVYDITRLPQVLSNLSI